MTVSPFTLNNLYSQGILDYVPYELCNGAVNVSSMHGMQNPYLNMAKQGDLYQSSGQVSDQFVSNMDIGSHSTITESTANGFGYIGSQSRAGGINAYGFDGSIGSANSYTESNAWGGVGKAYNNFQNNIGEVSSKLQGVPNYLKGALSALIIIGTLGAICKGSKSKKVLVEKSSAPSKWNPMNWFKSKKK